jgi:hypothetical protein
MHTTRKKGYEPIVERQRLGPNHGEEPFSFMQIITFICVFILVYGLILFAPRVFITHINKTNWAILISLRNIFSICFGFVFLVGCFKASFEKKELSLRLFMFVIGGGTLLLGLNGMRDLRSGPKTYAGYCEVERRINRYGPSYHLRISGFDLASSRLVVDTLKSIDPAQSYRHETDGIWRCNSMVKISYLPYNKVAIKVEKVGFDK